MDCSCCIPYVKPLLNKGQCQKYLTWAKRTRLMLSGPKFCSLIKGFFFIYFGNQGPIVLREIKEAYYPHCLRFGIKILIIYIIYNILIFFFLVMSWHHIVIFQNTEFGAFIVFLYIYKNNETNINIMCKFHFLNEIIEINNLWYSTFRTVCVWMSKVDWIWACSGI